jgi:formylglycine-generating enzyme required for sulfatase activity
MKHPLTSPLGLALAAGILATPAAAVVTIDWVTVLNAGNAADTRVMNDGSSGYGAVAYEYRIARNETSIGQYTEFLNAVAKTDAHNLYHPGMATTTYVAGISRTGTPGNYSYAPIGTSINMPVTFVSWFDAARFCNWLHNGQGNGSTETGAYTLNGAMSGIYTANPGAKAWIPTEDEWYKAAYYDPTKGAGAGGFWAMPNQSDTLPGNTIGVPGAANYYDGDYVGYPGMALTPGGAYGPDSASYYGTNDQGGNVYEWNDAVVAGAYRGVRGGAWNNSLVIDLEASLRYDDFPTSENHVYGFRVASIPEPATATLTLLAGGLLLLRRKR